MVATAIHSDIAQDTPRLPARSGAATMRGCFVAGSGWRPRDWAPGRRSLRGFQRHVATCDAPRVVDNEAHDEPGTRAPCAFRRESIKSSDDKFTKIMARRPRQAL